jgi:ubiquinone/menaquinone biosynthesis C-methylase UbiE
LFALGALGHDATVLEVGCGTGQATRRNSWTTATRRLPVSVTKQDRIVAER